MCLMLPAPMTKPPPFAKSVRLLMMTPTQRINQSPPFTDHALPSFCGDSALDTPRTAPDLPWVHTPTVQALLERLLFVRAVRSSAAGYVQGLCDVAVPFVFVFLSESSLCTGLHPDGWAARLSTLPARSPALAAAEADAYGCFCALLDSIQDQYTFAQPGVQRKAHTLGALLRRLDAPLHAHLKSLGLDEPLVYAFRWINCLLQRELPFTLVPRLFDTYLSEGDAFPQFFTYVLVAFLTVWSTQLRACPDFQSAVLVLQHPPTETWTVHDGQVAQLLGRAHQHRVTFAHAERHLDLV